VKLWKQMLARMVIGIAAMKRLALRFARQIELGPRAWLARLAGEQLAPTPAGAWSYVHTTSGCIGCGMCDVVAPDEEPSAWIVAAARQPENAALALERAARLRELSPAIEKLCPARVDVQAVARLIEENARALTTLKRS
jgi:hypothetical protein